MRRKFLRLWRKHASSEIWVHPMLDFLTSSKSQTRLKCSDRLCGFGPQTTCKSDSISDLFIKTKSISGSVYESTISLKDLPFLGIFNTDPVDDDDDDDDGFADFEHTESSLNHFVNNEENSGDPKTAIHTFLTLEEKIDLGNNVHLKPSVVIDKIASGEDRLLDRLLDRPLDTLSTFIQPEDQLQNAKFHNMQPKGEVGHYISEDDDDGTHLQGEGIEKSAPCFLKHV